MTKHNKVWHARSRLRALSFLLLLSIAVLTLCFPGRVSAATKSEIDTQIAALPQELWPQAPELNSQAAIVMEVHTGTILYAKDATGQHYPASTTKILTALLTLEHCTMEETVTISANAVNSLPPGSSHIGLKAGEQITVQQALYALLLPSANEVANALAEHVSGSIAAFTELMNSRAAELGCVNTHFSNANGLHADNHYTSAYDLAKIFAACIQNGTFTSIDATPSYVLPATNLTAETRPMSTTHQMMQKSSEYYNASVLGGKTGSTVEAGRCLITWARQNGVEVIVVTMGATHPNQYVDTQKLLDYSFQHFTYVRPADTTGNAVSADSLSPLQLPGQNLSLYRIEDTALVVLPDTLTFADLTEKTLFFDTPQNNITGTVTYTAKDYVLGQANMLSNTFTNRQLIYQLHPESVFSPASSVLNDSPDLITIHLWLVVVILLAAAGTVIGVGLLLHFGNPHSRAHRRRSGKKRRLY